MTRAITRTTVGIVGGGPAGLMLSHLLAIAGISSVVVDSRTRLEIENTVRAGILEADSVRLLTDTGVSDRVHRDGIAHDGIDLRFGGENHRIDFKNLAGESTWLYPQTDVFIDLANARDRDDGDVRFGISNTQVTDVTSDRPGILYPGTDAAGCEVRCDYLVGADGSQSICRFEVPASLQTHYFREYPFAWFGILAEAPKSAPELVYTHSPRGALSQRRKTVAQSGSALPGFFCRRTSACFPDLERSSHGGGFGAPGTPRPEWVLVVPRARRRCAVQPPADAPLVRADPGPA